MTSQMIHLASQKSFMTSQMIHLASQKSSNWVVKVYDVNDDLLASWAIENRTESQAFSEAEADVERIPHQADWTMTEHVGSIDTAPVPIEYKQPAFANQILNWYEYKKSNGISNAPMKGQTYHRETPKVGRNEPCVCNSGKKFKHCCGG
jgi:hypothetical protein